MDVLARLVPYNPQLLLAFTPSNHDLWSGLDPDWLLGEYGIGRFFIDIDSETIDFEPRYRDETVLIVSPSGRVVDELHRKTKIERNLTPFVVPHGRMVFGGLIESRQSGKTNKHIASAKWGEADTSPLDDIREMLDHFHGVQRVTVNKDSDFSDIERRVLAAMCLDGEVLIDLETSSGMIVGPGAAEALGLFPKRLPEEKPHKSYLDHDPTKRHNRRRRRGR